MLTELRFVMGAVAKKDFLPALTHFVIEDGTVRGYNGTIALCSPIPFDIACKPKAEPLVRAIANCTDTVSLAMTQAGRLSIKSGSFKAFIDCVDGETAHAEPEGDRLELDGAAMLAALKAVQPFIGDDASRVWTNGVLLRGQSAFATNNVSLVEFWIGSTFPVTVNLPRAAVKEIVRIDEAPIHAQIAETSFTLHYANGRWIRTQLLPTDWPDVSRILTTEEPVSMKELDKRLFDGLDVLRPFVDKMGRVFFESGNMVTHHGTDEGASFALDDFQVDGVYNIEILRLLDGVATHIDWSLYPRPCLFQGERLRGALIGMRKP
jgi:DNA polymerase III sliding clamp (beta) subunit (PCNA family)